MRELNLATHHPLNSILFLTIVAMKDIGVLNIRNWAWANMICFGQREGQTLKFGERKRYRVRGRHTGSGCAGVP